MTLRGTPKRRTIDAGATASVGETIAPKTNATGHEKPMSQCATAATDSVVVTTSPMASSEIEPTLALRSRKEEKNAAAESSGGRKISKTSSGASSILGTPGRK